MAGCCLSPLHSHEWARSSRGLALARLCPLLYSAFTPFCSFDKISTKGFEADRDHSCLGHHQTLVCTSHCHCNRDQTGGSTRASDFTQASASMWSRGLSLHRHSEREDCFWVSHLFLICRFWIYAALKEKKVQRLIISVIRNSIKS